MPCEKYNGIYGLGEWRERLNAKGEALLCSKYSLKKMLVAICLYIYTIQAGEHK